MDPKLKKALTQYLTIVLSHIANSGLMLVRPCFLYCLLILIGTVASHLVGSFLTGLVTYLSFKVLVFLIRLHLLNQKLIMVLNNDLPHNLHIRQQWARNYLFNLEYFSVDETYK